MKYNYFGKYRAIVNKVENPRSINTRIKVKCPSVLGQSPSTWCYPCIPFINDDFVITDPEELYPLRVPRVGDPVWVEFEGGDLSKPIWIGTWR